MVALFFPQTFSRISVPNTGLKKISNYRLTVTLRSGYGKVSGMQALFAAVSSPLLLLKCFKVCKKYFMIKSIVYKLESIQLSCSYKSAMYSKFISFYSFLFFLFPLMPIHQIIFLFFLVRAWFFIWVMEQGIFFLNHKEKIEIKIPSLISFTSLFLRGSNWTEKRLEQEFILRWRFAIQTSAIIR